MKKLITAGALLAVLASPAFAQKYRGAYAQANQPAHATTDNGFTGDAQGQIIWGGKVRGQDPDWFIRSQISRGLGNYGAD
ncbi:MAG: hypothetical protein K8F62_07690 [Pseudorhodoplanes sp.]|nr:hypothetical protein [Pseudorhodoplanes sp.]